MICARVFLLIVLIGSAYGTCRDDCPQEKLMFLYESFGCTSQCSPGDCPTEYKCDDFNSQPNSCYFNGCFYNNTENIQNSLTWERCRGCTCEATENATTFICYVADCQMVTVKEGCRLDHKLGECCSVPQVCPPFGTCEIDGQTYLEGEKFDHPSKKCTRCYCGKGKGGEVDHRCETQYCLDLLEFQTEIRRNCAPLYRTSSVCCPSMWICPESVTKYEKGNGTEAGPQCTFGEKKLNIGDKFFYSDASVNATCECIIPPYASCTQEN